MLILYICTVSEMKASSRGFSATPGIFSAEARRHRAGRDADFLQEGTEGTETAQQLTGMDRTERIGGRPADEEFHQTALRHDGFGRDGV
jgi:hypothetical protein